MTLEIALRYVHFISIFAIVGSLMAEYVLLKKTMTRAEISRVSRIDAMYGMAAITLVMAGFTLWLSGVGKPTWFYSKNWIFLLKISLVAVVSLLSIYPTVFFLKNRKGESSEMVTVPASVFTMLRLELGLLFVIPLLAGLMAHGIGFFGN